MSQIKVNSIVPVGGLSGSASGGIIQIVQGSTTSSTSDTGGTFVDTNISATITPSSNSNKILAIATIQWELYRDASEVYGGLRLLRGSTDISNHESCIHHEAGTTGQSRIIAEGGYPIQCLDSPATTSATTYKIQCRVEATGSSGRLRISPHSAPSVITLYEVST